ncbi:FAD-dependent monooxygenase [Streptomyces sp. NPDC054844]
MSILIAGAGIGGLIAALSLHTAGCEDVRVVEAAPEIRPLGAGINLLPNAVRELAALGLYGEPLRRSVPLEQLGYFNHHGQTVWSERRGHGAGHRWPQLAMPRGSLQELLADRVAERLGPDAVRTDARLAGFAVADSGRVQVDLGRRARGGTASTVETDVLVGADGIRSAVRGTLYPQEGAPRSQGVVVWRGVPRSRPFMGGRSMVVMDRDPLPRWSFGPVTLLGDAAHAMAPMGSNATAQAVVDARAQAHALSLHAEPVHALREYDRERRPAMNRLQLMNRAKDPEVVIDLACARARSRDSPAAATPTTCCRTANWRRSRTPTRRLPAPTRTRPTFPPRTGARRALRVRFPPVRPADPARTRSCFLSPHNPHSP